MITTISDIRERLKLEELSDDEIMPHLKRANRDFKGKVFDPADDNFDEIEAVSCKAIYYIAPLLWQRIQQKALEYDETLQTFGDVEVFQEYWLDRSESIPVKDENSGKVDTGGITCRAV
jgi:hypothetical protein